MEKPVNGAGISGQLGALTFGQSRVHRCSTRFYIWVGSLDERSDLELVGHWYADSRLPWDDICMDIPSHSEIFDERN